MKYLIARRINQISINGNEYLLDDFDNEISFRTKQACIDYCKSVGLDESYVWEIEE